MLRGLAFLYKLRDICGRPYTESQRMSDISGRSLRDGLLTFDQAGKELGKCGRTVRRFTQLAENPLPVVRVGKTPYIRRPTVEKWLARQERTANQAPGARRGRRPQWMMKLETP
jgi:hypothetical protein